MKLKLVESHCYETYNGQEVKKKNKEEAKADLETKEDEQKVPVPPVTHVNNILHSILHSNVEVYITNHQIYNSNGMYGTSYIFLTSSREPSLNTRWFCLARVRIVKNFLMKLWKRFCPNLFSQGERKCLVDPMVS